MQRRILFIFIKIENEIEIGYNSINKINRETTIKNNAKRKMFK